MAETDDNAIGGKGRRRAKSSEIPESIRKKFVQVGKQFYFRDGTRAFTDAGTRLTTLSENTEVIRSLVEIAKARRWNDVTVRGTDRFRREAWFASKLLGMTVKGYEATEFEIGKLESLLAQRNQVAPNTAPEPKKREQQNKKSDPGREDELISGTLVSHGRAPYKNNPNGQMSYFVKLQAARGERVIWGVDLERAILESHSKPQTGDQVGLRAIGRDPVTINTGGDQARQAHRNRWIIEKQTFLDGRAEAAKVVRDSSVDAKDAIRERPELAGTYLKLHLAELVAKKRLGSAQDQKQFVQTVRSTLADAILRGEPLPPIRMRDRTRSPPERDPENARVR